MFFGLYKATTSFQVYINKILVEKLNIFVIVYLDNILIYTQNLSQSHKQVAYWVLDQLKKYGFFGKLKNCPFYQD